MKSTCAVLLDLTFSRVRPAPLHDQLTEDLVGHQDVLGIVQVFGGNHPVNPHPLAQRLFHLVEVRPQVVHAYRARKVLLVAAGEEFGHVAEVTQAVVDRGGGEHEHRLGTLGIVQKIEHAIVARWLDPPVGIAAPTRIPEVVGLVDDDYIRQFRDAPEALGKVALASQVGVVENRQVAEVRAPADSADVREPVSQVRLPHPFPGRLRCEEDDALSFVQHQTLDEHQPNERLAETHAVAKEGTAVPPGDLHERPIRLLLVAIQLVEHLRASLVPLGRGELVAPEELLQRPGVDLEWRMEASVAPNGLDDRIVDLAGEFPVRLKPLLELRDLARALDLDVQLDVLCEAGPGEVAGADQRLGTRRPRAWRA